MLRIRIIYCHTRSAAPCPIVDCQQDRGPVHHVAVAPAHTAGGVVILDQGLQVAGGQDAPPPDLVRTGPAVRLGGAGHRRLQGDVPPGFPQGQHRLPGLGGLLVDLQLATSAASGKMLSEAMCSLQLTYFIQNI